MDDPDPELTANADERADAPDFDALTQPSDAVSGTRTRDDFFDVVLGLESPTPVSEVADRAGHGADAAREYLEWFERMGIVTKVTDSPTTYERNREYLRWRRVQQLRAEYTTDELLSHLEAERARDDDYAETFDVASPNAVSITTYATETDRSVEAVWEDVSAWQTTRRRIDLLERAITTDVGDPTADRTAV